MVTHIARVRINRVRLYQSCTSSVEQGKIIFPCPRSNSLLIEKYFYNPSSGIVVVVVVVFTLKAVPVSTQYFLTSVLVQLTRTPSVVTG